MDEKCVLAEVKESGALLQGQERDDLACVRIQDLLVKECGISCQVRDSDNFYQLMTG